MYPKANRSILLFPKGNGLSHPKLTNHVDQCNKTLVKRVLLTKRTNHSWNSGAPFPQYTQKEVELVQPQPPHTLGQNFRSVSRHTPMSTRMAPLSHRVTGTVFNGYERFLTPTKSLARCHLTTISSRWRFWNALSGNTSNSICLKPANSRLTIFWALWTHRHRLPHPTANPNELASEKCTILTRLSPTT